ncbi:MAG: glycosyltransferase [Paludibacteraceae bacterium]|nr:glycosyltransferase [Paludibacteraceae bacterium]
MLLSIILPCYNVEEYIAECLDSLYNQDISETEYEIICVNDCSPDGTRKVISNYQKSHQNLILIDHEKNLKQGGARNTGLKKAIGEYIWFVDPDDYIKPNVLKQLLDHCRINQLDILQFNYEKVTTTGLFVSKQKNVSNSIVLTGIDLVLALGDDFLYNYTLSVCSRIVSLKFLKEKKIVFIENTIFEDLEFSLRALLFSKRIQCVEESFYCYRFNSTSTTNKLNNSNSIKGESIFQTCLVIGNSLVDLSLDINPISEKISKEIYSSGVWRINQITRPLLKIGNNELKNFYSLLTIDFINKLSPYLNKANKIIIKYPVITKVIIYVTRPLLFVIKKMKK